MIILFFDYFLSNKICVVDYILKSQLLWQKESPYFESIPALSSFLSL